MILGGFAAIIGVVQCDHRMRCTRTERPAALYVHFEGDGPATARRRALCSRPRSPTNSLQLLCNSPPFYETFVRDEFDWLCVNNGVALKAGKPVLRADAGAPRHDDLEFSPCVYICSCIPSAPTFASQSWTS
ncbi:hypothetical protein PENSPDRAFT_649546 [Peniophora sp. CONT]|nr:hypothetical protein PENSPDRAFT_649546 [Peniophora sp. CONT]